MNRLTETIHGELAAWALAPACLCVAAHDLLHCTFPGRPYIIQLPCLGPQAETAKQEYYAMNRILLCTMIAVGLIVASCASAKPVKGEAAAAKPKTGQNTKMALVQPQAIANLTLVGNRNGTAVQYVFKDNGVLEYSFGEAQFRGTWEYQAAQQMMKYTIDWVENGKKQGYMVDIFKSGDDYTIHGYWYLNDDMIALTDQLKVKQ